MAHAAFPVITQADVLWTAMRAQGAGGQNVNKVSSAVHLRFDIRASALPADMKERLLIVRDGRITQEGIVVIKAQRYRSQDLNLADALVRLNALVYSVAEPLPVRKPTRPTMASQLRRMNAKLQRGQTKTSRRSVCWD